MSNDSIGAPLHSYPTATPAQRLIYASEVLLDFQSGTRIAAEGRSVENVPQQDKAWAGAMAQAQQAKTQRPPHPDEQVEASLHAGEVAGKVKG